MGHTFSNILLHIIFSTKDRRPFLDAAIRPRLCQYLTGIATNTDVRVLRVGGVDDHIHLLLRLQPTQCCADVVRALKANSSSWLKRELVDGESFTWQPGYAVFSVSESVAPKVCEYIDGQEEHHRHVSFREELEVFLEKHGLKWHPDDLP